MRSCMNVHANEGRVDCVRVTVYDDQVVTVPNTYQADIQCPNQTKGTRNRRRVLSPTVRPSREPQQPHPTRKHDALLLSSNRRRQTGTDRKAHEGNNQRTSSSSPLPSSSLSSNVRASNCRHLPPPSSRHRVRGHEPRCHLEAVQPSVWTQDHLVRPL